MITQAKVNGNTKDIIITNAYEDSEFFKKIKNYLSQKDIKEFKNI